MWLAMFSMATILVLTPLVISLPKTPAAHATVYMTPNCPCCAIYADYLKRRGFEVEIIKMEYQNLTAIKRQYGVQPILQSCHTSIIDGYFVEGHIPVEIIEKLLKEKPDISGIALPGMPEGAPGMHGSKEGPFVIYALLRDGNIRVYATV